MSSAQSPAPATSVQQQQHAALSALPFDARFYPEVQAGGFSRGDGTLQFYIRVNALIEASMVVVDLGAGRGGLSDTDPQDFRNALVRLKGRVRKVIGVDVDPVVRSNPLLDESIVYDGEAIPLPDASVDLIVSDYTFEHIPNPQSFAREVARILKPGGWICARTPNLFSAVMLASSVIPNRHHSGLLRFVQPSRQTRDVFPTRYKMNSGRAIRALFPADRWIDASYTWSPGPSYHFNNPLMFRLMQAFQYLKQPLLGGEVRLIFLQKRAAAAA